MAIHLILIINPFYLLILAFILNAVLLIRQIILFNPQLTDRFSNCVHINQSKNLFGGFISILIVFNTIILIQDIIILFNPDLLVFTSGSLIILMILLHFQVLLYSYLIFLSMNQKRHLFLILMILLYEIFVVLILIPILTNWKASAFIFFPGILALLEWIIMPIFRFTKNAINSEEDYEKLKKLLEYEDKLEDEESSSKSKQMLFQNSIIYSKKNAEKIGKIVLLTEAVLMILSFTEIILLEAGRSL